MKQFILLHRPGDEQAPKDGVPSRCKLCSAPLICSRAGSSLLLPNTVPICFDCAEGGPEHVLRHLELEERDGEEA